MRGCIVLFVICELPLLALFRSQFEFPTERHKQSIAGVVVFIRIGFPIPNMTVQEGPRPISIVVVGKRTANVFFFTQGHVKVGKTLKI
jgi:hypothetical protein